jgi:large-conductance mechanosensitive channel
MRDGAQRCVNKIDPSVTVHLNAQGAVLRSNAQPSVFSIADLQSQNPDAYARYSSEQTRFQEELEAANSQVSHQARVDAAGRDVLASGGNDPTKNAAYNALAHDPDAMNVLYENQIQKDVGKFINEYHFLNTQTLQQQQTLDIVNSVKDNIGTVKDDMAYSVSTFQDQIKAIQNQVNINRKTQVQAADYGSWIGIALNVLIVLVLLFLIFSIGRRAMRGSTSTAPGTGAPAPSLPADSTDFFNAFARHLGTPKPPT